MFWHLRNKTSVLSLCKHNVVIFRWLGPRYWHRDILQLYYVLISPTKTKSWGCDKPAAAVFYNYWWYSYLWMMLILDDFREYNSLHYMVIGHSSHWIVSHILTYSPPGSSQAGLALVELNLGWRLPTLLRAASTLASLTTARLCPASSSRRFKILAFHCRL